MKPDRWQRVKEIFQAALERTPPERTAFVSKACAGDQDLRKEVESLMSSDARGGEFLDSPAYEAAAELLVNEKVELKPGQAIGSYEIISFISRGGMGEVYLAQDRRLSRKVALKLLPVSFTKDRERLARFEQEARAASALNHPNIITIYEILKTPSTHVIATEFVEGETLRNKLARSSLDLRESLHVALQVADALAAAHHAGIVHRDIKPENIMLRPDRYVKVLDFGLAKLAEQSPDVPIEEALTKQVRTGSGVVIGTIGYMSPEQARGKTVDARSDIFSFGAVLYEMVTRQKPFDGETPSDVLAAILKTEPPPVTEILPDAPAELARIVAKAVRKDRDERYQTIGDLLLDLKSLKQELEFQARLGHAASLSDPPRSIAPVTQSATAQATAEPQGAVTTISQALSGELKRHPTRLVISLAIIAIVVIAGAVGLYALLNRTAPRIHFQSSTIARITNAGKVIDARLSNDGTYLLYCLSDAGKQSLWLRQVSTANDKVIVAPAPVGFFGITFSPDDREIYYVVKANYDAGTLYRVPVLGGTPTRILEKIDSPVTFSPNRKQLAFVRANFPAEDQSALIIAKLDGSSEQALATRLKPDRFAPIFFTAPSWSPDGKLIAASVFTLGGGSRVIAFPVSAGKEINLSPDPWPFSSQVQWLPDMSGLLVVAGSGPGAGAQLWFVSYPSGEKRQITNDLDQHRAIGLTADGSKFVNVVGSGIITVFVSPSGDTSRAIQLSTDNIGWGAGYANTVAWTPDGRIVVSSVEGVDVNLWITNADGTNRQQLTSNVGRNVGPTISPDGRYVVFSSTRGGRQNIWRTNIDGTSSKQLTQGVAESMPAVSPDGRWVVYTALGTTRPTIWKVSIDGGDASEITHRVSTTPTISPDGKFIAYLYTEAPDPLVPPNKIAIIPFDGGDPVKTFSCQVPGTIQMYLQWSADGKSILYDTNTNSVTNVWSQPIDGSPPKQVTDFKDSFMTGFTYSRDGKQLACSRGIFTRDAVIITETN